MEENFKSIKSPMMVRIFVEKGVGLLKTFYDNIQVIFGAKINLLLCNVHFAFHD